MRWRICLVGSGSNQAGMCHWAPWRGSQDRPHRAGFNPNSRQPCVPPCESGLPQDGTVPSGLNLCDSAQGVVQGSLVMIELAGCSGARVACGYARCAFALGIEGEATVQCCFEPSKPRSQVDGSHAGWRFWSARVHAKVAEGTTPASVGNPLVSAGYAQSTRVRSTLAGVTEGPPNSRTWGRTAAFEVPSPG